MTRGKQEQYRDGEAEEYVTWKGFVAVMIPLLIVLIGAQIWIVRVHAELPYHPGVTAVAYEKARGDVLEARLSRIESDIKDLKAQVETNNTEIKDMIKEITKELRRRR